eukprot:TRINITY_DN3174_c0_g1_i10.p1 TRINITY_DN3174_c0_g1~~TRINITY_DN3174_c0_g1_i10.p1  ORF type:complete len:940 (-),score=89.50 TRINITY_DN3174_c0_g1_i10:3302-5845(-)
MLYIFIGISIIADIFMSAVEVITSQKRTVLDSEGNEIVIRIWNPTVANLSLLALGSSAPEILLSVIETVQKLGESPGALGPSTIVGSASFNLLIISAVCIIVVGPQAKRITSVGVFYITAVWSVLVYVWMFIVLEVWTPQVVTLTEAIITLGAFAVFITMAYLQDRNCFCMHPSAVSEVDDVNSGNLEQNDSQQYTVMVRGNSKDKQVNKHQLKGLLKFYKVGKLANKTTTAVVKALAALKVFDDKKKRNDAIFHKINARHQLAGKKHYALKRPNQQDDKLPQEELELPSRFYTQQLSAMPQTTQADLIQIEFTSFEFRQLESSGSVLLNVRRTGALQQDVYVDYFTIDGSAKDGQDYVGSRGTVHIKANSEMGQINIKLMNREGVQGDRFFRVALDSPRWQIGLADEESLEFPTIEALQQNGNHRILSDNELLAVSTSTHEKALIRLGKLQTASVVIMDVDYVGFIGFDDKEYSVMENGEYVELKVVRDYGSSGRVSVEYNTMDGSAISGRDYVESRGELVFEDGQAEAYIRIEVIDNDIQEPDRIFHVTLSNPTGGAQLNPRSLALVKIIDDDSLDELQDQVNSALRNKAQVLYHASDSWYQQFVDALSPGGQVDEEGEETEPTKIQLILHFFGMFWKVVFAMVPPTQYWNGWAAFWVSIVFIGILTAIVAELATLFGCYTGLSPAITAITFVALGTSLPDTFASMQAAVSADDADAAIGNVTGSNTVNVLLGLGLPWLIGSIYYRIQYPDHPNVNGRFCVPSGSLAYSVMIFTICAVIGLAILILRRRYVGGELGGSISTKWLSGAALIILWILYIVLSALQDYGHIDILTQDSNLDSFGCVID